MPQVQRFRVDTSGASFRVDGIEAKTDRDGNVVKDRRSGEPKFVVHLTVREGDRAATDKWAVTVLGEPKVSVDAYVVLRGLVAFPWEQNGRHGIALNAESVVPAVQPVKNSA